MDDRGIRLEEEGCQMTRETRWNVYHVLPPILILLFVIINDIMICLIVTDDDIECFKICFQQGNNSSTGCYTIKSE